MDNLVKATNPKDFAHMQERADANGPVVADHKFHIGAHPPHPEADDFQQNIAKHPNTIKATGVDGPMQRRTVSPKQIYKSPSGQKFLLKLYHEARSPNVPYTRFPIMGWSEMAMQALYHAGGIGNLHQKVHVSEHETPQGVQPMLVIAMDPKSNRPISDFDNYLGPYPRKLYDDSVKIGMMDFLTNNNDRHNENMMYHQPEPTANCHFCASNLLAIDNSLAFQYKQPNRFFFKRTEKMDSLYPYVVGAGYAGHESLNQPDSEWTPWNDAHLQHGVDWWKANRQKVRDEMKNQLQGIKHDEIRDFIAKNFNVRADALDRWADAWTRNPDAFDHDLILDSQNAMRSHGVRMVPFLPPAQEKVA